MKKTKFYSLIVIIFILGSFTGLTFLLKSKNYVNFDTVINFRVVIGMILWILISVFIHEFGHLVFGLITKFRFLSFQFFTLFIKKNKNKGLTIKRISFNGLAGQCLMAPPKTNKKPFVLYNLGGIIFNFLFFLILYFILLYQQINYFWWSVFYSGAFINYLFAIVNAIPLKGVLNNDGLNMLNYYTNPVLINNIYQNLNLVAQLTDDVLYQDIDINDLSDEIDYRNNFEVFTLIIKFFKLKALEQEEESLLLLQNLYQNRYRMIENYRNLVEMMYFCELALSDNVEEARFVFNRFDKRVKKLLPHSKVDWGFFTHLLSQIIDNKSFEALKLINKANEKAFRTSYLADEIRMKNMLSKIKNKGETYAHSSIQITP